MLHGTYNTLSGGWLGIVVAALSILVFIFYVRTDDVISREITADQEPASLETLPVGG